MATIRDIAQLSGVSIATISRALNKPDTVSPETLQLVLQYVDELNYQLKRKTKKMTNLFGVILPNITNPFFMELLEVLENESYLHGRSILFFNSKQNARQELIALHECEAHGVDGVFLTPVGDLNRQYQQKINQYRFQTVILTRSATALPSVAVDHEYGGRMSAAHLVSLGHSEVGYIGFLSPHDEKFTGFSRYLEEQGQPLKSDHIFDISQNRTLPEFIRHIVQVKHVTAIGCENDVLARRIVDTVREMSDISEDQLTLVGFDNSLISKLLHFSSIAQPMREMAHLGFESMLQALKTPIQTEYQPQLLLPRLVVRNTLLN